LRHLSTLAGAASSSTVAGEEVVQPADKAEEPDDAAKGIGELYELVDDAGEVNLSICGACKGLHD
jgi:hypothetical protein